MILTPGSRLFSETNQKSLLDLIEPSALNHVKNLGIISVHLSSSLEPFIHHHIKVTPHTQSSAGYLWHRSFTAFVISVIIALFWLQRIRKLSLTSKTRIIQWPNVPLWVVKTFPGKLFKSKTMPAHLFAQWLEGSLSPLGFDQKFSSVRMSFLKMATCQMKGRHIQKERRNLK